MKKYIVFFLTLFLIVSCAEQTPENQTRTQTTSENTEIQSQQEKIKVTASIVPLSSVVNTVGGEFVEVQNIVPAGVSPHGFDMSARDMAELSESQIVFLVGLEHIDGFLEKAAEWKKQIHLADGMELIEVDEHSHEEHSGDHHNEEEGHDDDYHHEDEHRDYDHSEDHHDEEKYDEHKGEDDHDEHNHDEHNHESDPHVWLGKDNIISIAETVRDELSAVLPEQAPYFAANTKAFKSDVEALYTEFATQTAGKTPREFIVFHDAYNYLMQSVGMDLNLRVPFTQNVLHESGTAYRAELIEEVELHGVKNIFREPQFRDGNLQKFADEYNLQIGILDPLGADESASGYLETLRKNLETLATIYE